MGKFYENSEPDGIQSDHDLRIAILNKTKAATKELKTIIDNNIQAYNIITFRYGEEAMKDYPNKAYLMQISLYLEAFSGLIVNNLCALIGKGKNDTLSIYKHKKSYDEKAIDAFYLRHEEKLSSLTMARNKVYAHIDTNVTEHAFLINIRFFERCLNFVERILKGGQKHE